MTQAMFAFPGVITHAAGERGVIKHVIYSRHGEPTGAMVRLDERSVIVHVSLGMRALTCTCGADALVRQAHSPHCNLMSNLSTNYREVTGWREVDRDEFDHLTGIDTLRAEFGWHNQRERARN